MLELVIFVILLVGGVWLFSLALTALIAVLMPFYSLALLIEAWLAPTPEEQAEIDQLMADS